MDIGTESREHRKSLPHSGYPPCSSCACDRRRKELPCRRRQSRISFGDGWRQKWLLLLLISVQATTNLTVESFLLSSPLRPRPIYAVHSGTRLYQEKAEKNLAKEPSRVNVNTRVQDVLHVLALYQDKEEEESSIGKQIKLGPAWSKTRNYLYNQKDLSVDQARKVIRFLDDVLLGDTSLVCSVVQSNPRILRKSVDNYLIPTAQFLQELYGAELFCEAVKRNPGILLSRGMGHNAPEDVVVAIEELLTSFLGLKSHDIITLKKKAPGLFQSSAPQIRSVLDFLDNLLQKTGNASEIKRQAILGKLLKSYPTIFLLSVDTGLKPKVSFLEQQCGFATVDVASLLKGSRAAMLCLSIEGNLQPTLQILQDLMPPGSLDENRQCIRDCIFKHPQILCLSQANLREKISYFDSIDVLCSSKACRSESLASRVARGSPVVFSLSLKENIKPKVAFLARIWGVQASESDSQTELHVMDPKSIDETENGRRYSTASLSGLLGEYPSILTLSLEGNIQPTLHFYNQTGFIHLDKDWNWKQGYVEALPNGNDGGNSSSTKQSTSKRPMIRARYIACSLFQRLLPRWHFYLQTEGERAMSETSKQNSTSTDKLDPKLSKPSLHVLSVASDSKFCDYLGVAHDEFKTFKEDTIPRLKFSSQFDTWLKTGRPIDV